MTGLVKLNFERYRDNLSSYEKKANQLFAASAGNFEESRHLFEEILRYRVADDKEFAGFGEQVATLETCREEIKGIQREFEELALEYAAAQSQIQDESWERKFVRAACGLEIEPGAWTGYDNALKNVELDQAARDRVGEVRQGLMHNRRTEDKIAWQRRTVEQHARRLELMCLAGWRKKVMIDAGDQSDILTRINSAVNITINDMSLMASYANAELAAYREKKKSRPGDAALLRVEYKNRLSHIKRLTAEIAATCAVALSVEDLLDDADDDSSWTIRHLSRSSNVFSTEYRRIIDAMEAETDLPQPSSSVLMKWMAAVAGTVRA